MKFIMTFSWKPDPKIRDEAISRFQKVGAYPPQGVKLLRAGVARISAVVTISWKATMPKLWPSWRSSGAT